MVLQQWFTYIQLSYLQEVPDEVQLVDLFLQKSLMKYNLEIPACSAIPT